MHKIVSSHLKKFVTEHSLDNLERSKQFERFSNFCIIYKYYPTRFDINEVTSEEDDCGIDGIAFIIDNELVTTSDEAHAIFKKKNKLNIRVDIIFIQSKTSEKFERGEILKFGSGVSNFLSDVPRLPQGEFIKKSKELFNIIIENVPKIAYGKPDCHLFYVTTGNYNNKAVELEAAFQEIDQKLKNDGYFRNVSVLPVGKDELVNFWSLTYSGVKAKFEVKGYVPYPEQAGIKEAYLAIVPAKNFVKSVLSDEDGKLRNFIFQENVRSFLGQENPVNKMIKNTLSNDSGRERFGILNNGITIISPSITVQSTFIYIENFQIVNGCQTSNVLYENLDTLSDETMLTVKVVEATDSDVIIDIVKATNSQTKVENIQFLSLKPIIRKVEEYFEAVAEDSDDEIKLYFERRERQFVGAGIPENRIFDIKEASRAVASMFLERPDLAARYPTQMIEELNEKLFNDQNKEITFYTACIALYRIKLLIGNKKLPYNYGKYKWHMLMCLKYAIAGRNESNLTSHKQEKFCQQIIDVCKDLNEDHLNYFKNVESIIKETGEVNRDKLKTQTYTEELKKLIKN